MGKTLLDKAVSRLPGLAESLDAHKIGLPDMTEICIFGYGSLPGNPHWPPSSMMAAFLRGWRRRFCCACSGRGTEEFPGLTLGLEEEENGIVPGAVLRYGGMTTEGMAQMLHVFADREVPDIPIYRFGFARIETARGETLPAIVCIADCQSPHYRTGLSLTEKSQIIAMACGEWGTCKDYLDRYIRSHIRPQTDFSDTPPARRTALQRDRDYFTALLREVDQRRAEMRLTMPDYLAALEMREQKTQHLQTGDKQAALV